MKDETTDDIVSAVDLGTWSFSEEREFMESLFVGRFNYFLLVFSLFLTAGFANTFQTYKWTVFVSGALLLLMVWGPLFRAYQKHDRIMRVVFRKKSHPASQVQRLIDLEGFKSHFRASWIMGVGVPLTCISLHMLAAGAIALELLK